MLQDLIIFKKNDDFSKWLFNHTNKFPKSYCVNLNWFKNINMKYSDIRNLRTGAIV